MLYVEDNPANLRLLQKIISKRGDVDFISAINGIDGLELVRRELPSLILLDINMPGMDGYEVLKNLKENPLVSSIPVIAVTSNAMKRDVERGLAAGFADYITKPVKINQINEILNKYLHG